MKANPSSPVRMNPTEASTGLFPKQAETLSASGSYHAQAIGSLRGALAHCLCVGSAKGRAKPLLLAFQFCLAMFQGTG